MAIFKKISTEQEEEICKRYRNGESITALQKVYKIAEYRIKGFLSDRGIEIRDPRKKKNMDTFDCVAETNKFFPPVEGKTYIAIYNEDETVRFKDYTNKSGQMTTFLRSIGMDVPTLVKRTTYFKRNGKPWYFQFFHFELISTETDPTKKCPYCGKEIKGGKYILSTFFTHLSRYHGIDNEQYFKDHPEDADFLNFSTPTLRTQFETDQNKYIRCKICGMKLKKICGAHLNTHGLTKEAYIMRFGFDALVSKDFHDRMSELTTEMNATMENTFESKAETEIKEHIRSYGIECKKTHIEGSEIDIYIPSLKIGIEYNGILYHSEWFGKKSHSYHLEKLEKCAMHGIRLISIFEDEYYFNKEIVLNKIGHIIGIRKDAERIMARKCTVCEVPKDIANTFLEKNHLQGKGPGSIRYGCYYGEKLIAVMTFKIDKPTDNGYELTRFATDNDYICSGVGGKLFARFVKDYAPDSVKSFADRRWTTNISVNMYTKIGFAFDGFVRPDYMYINRHLHRCRRFHKFSMRKQKLMKMDPSFNESMTEKEMAKALGYDRIWNCGLIRYVWRKEAA